MVWITQHLESLHNPILFWGLLLSANVLMYLTTIIISRLWSSFYQHESATIKKRDIILSIIVVFVNVIVAIPGYLLFLHSKITFDDAHFLRDFGILFFLIDFFMYVLHFVAHYIWPFKLLHKEHHLIGDFNSISLYIMNPLEALFFGIILTIFPLLLSLNLYSFLLIIFINWLLGVIAHLHTSSNKKSMLFGNNIFHKQHHEYSSCNYGFFTVLWDRLFGTYCISPREEEPKKQR